MLGRHAFAAFYLLMVRFAVPRHVSVKIKEGLQLIKKALLVCLLLLLSPLVFAQAVPSAEGSGRSIWVGAEGSLFNPDWGCQSSSPFSCGDGQLVGVAAFTDVNRIIGKIGVEGEARWLLWHGRTTQSNYLFGPRYPVISRRNLSVNLKFLAGGATIRYPHQPNWDGWTAFAPGITFGYRVSQRFLVRGDYEYQIWPGYVGLKGAHGLTPNGFSAGVSYRLFR